MLRLKMGSGLGKEVVMGCFFHESASRSRLARRGIWHARAMVALWWWAPLQAVVGFAMTAGAAAPDPATGSVEGPRSERAEARSEATLGKPAIDPEEKWSFHAQNTDIVQYHPGFSASYSGPNSLSHANDVRETVSLDLLAGVRLWRGAEFHVDGLMWQGVGINKKLGVERVPNAEAFRLGTKVPNVVFSRLLSARPLAWAANGNLSRERP